MTIMISSTGIGTDTPNVASENIDVGSFCRNSLTYPRSNSFLLDPFVLRVFSLDRRLHPGTCTCIYPDTHTWENYNACRYDAWGKKTCPSTDIHLALPRIIGPTV